jgi:hypothetical protein
MGVNGIIWYHQPLQISMVGTIYIRLSLMYIMQDGYKDYISGVTNFLEYLQYLGLKKP